MDRYFEVKKIVYAHTSKETAQKKFKDFIFELSLLQKYKNSPTLAEIEKEYTRIKKDSKRKKRLKEIEKRISSKQDFLNYFVLPLLAKRKLYQIYKNDPSVFGEAYLKGLELFKKALDGEQGLRDLLVYEKFKIKKVIYYKDMKLITNKKKKDALPAISGDQRDIWKKEIMDKFKPKKGDVFEGLSNTHKKEIVFVSDVQQKNQRYVFTILELSKISFNEWILLEKKNMLNKKG